MYLRIPWYFIKRQQDGDIYLYMRVCMYEQAGERAGIVCLIGKEVMIMKTEDHLALARSLTRPMNISRWQKEAFCFGNIEPDYNRLSYLGHRKEHFSNGHSYQCRKKYIFEFMSRPYQDNVLWWYRAGKVFHYMTDSFCRPHNPEFGYNSAAHVKYEFGLHDIFKRAMKGNPWKIPKVEPDLRSWLETRHLRYMARTKGVQDDCYYIITTVTAVWNWMVENKI